MRAFIAIELPPEIRSALSSIQEQLKSSGADVKWVAAQNIHLTLKFLGDINEGQLSRISEILDAVAGQKKVFAVWLSCLGAFPNINYPRLIWIGIDKGGKESGELAGALEEGLEKTGIPKEERPFSSHITIGRIRSSLGKYKLAAALKNLENYFNENPQGFTANKITLFKSTLTPKGPVYEIVKEASLTAT